MKIQSCANIFALTAVVLFASSHTSTATAAGSRDVSTIQARLGAQSSAWTPNAGQWDSRAAFRASSFGGAVWVTNDGNITYQLPEPGQSASASSNALPTRSHRKHAVRAPDWVLSERFVSSQPVRKTVGVMPRASQVSYAIGNDPTRHGQDLPQFGQLDLGEVFPGVSVSLKAAERNVEKLFTVAPQASASTIKMRMEGTRGLRIGVDGALEAETGYGPVRFTAPVAFQTIDGARHDVSVRYVMKEGSTEYGFAVGEYDASQPLVIDPLMASTFLGSTSFDEAYGIAISQVSGNVYVTGRTLSTTFPSVSGPAPANAGVNDAFVSMLDANLSSVLKTVFVGSNGNEYGMAVAVHPHTGDVYVTGFTGSNTPPPSALPGVTAPVAQAAYAGGSNDAFITRLSGDLSTLYKTTYLGTTDSDSTSAIVVHPISGDVYVAGSVLNSSGLPATSGAAIPTHSGALDAFITRIKPDLSAFKRTTYFGGNGSDIVSGLAIHPASGDIYITGYSILSATPIQGLTGAPQTANAGGHDIFVARFNEDLSKLLQATYFGGTADDDGGPITIHPITGDVYVAGLTNSTSIPGTAGASQTTTSGGQEGFVARFSADLKTLYRSTFLGGTGNDKVNAMTIHPISGEIFVTGDTASTDFPVSAGAYQATGGTNNDAFIARFDPTLAYRRASTYFGASGTDNSRGIAIHPGNGDLYFAGETTSASFIVTGGAAQTSLAGSADAFVTRISPDLLAGDAMPVAFTFPSKVAVPPTTLVQTSDPVKITGLSGGVTMIVSGTTGSAYCVSTTNSCTCDATLGNNWALPDAAAPATVVNNNYLCVRHPTANAYGGSSQTSVTVGGYTTQFTSFVGQGPTNGCAVDIDGNGTISAATDGLLLVRAMLGFTGTAVTSGALGSGTLARSDWASIRAFLNANCGTNFAP